MIRAALHILRALPRALEREHLRWAAREMSPLHPELPWVIRRIRELS